MSTENVETLNVQDGTAYGEYKFTFDSSNASTTSINITDTDGTKDSYTFFGGIFEGAEGGAEIASCLTSIKSKFSFDKGKLTIKGLDKATDGNATGVVFDGGSTDNSQAKQSLYGNELIFGYSTESSQITASLDMNDLLNNIESAQSKGFTYDAGKIIVVKS